MCAQESSFNTYRIENGCRIINIIIQYIYYTNSLTKDYVEHSQNTVAKRFHNSTSNQPGVSARLELLIEVLQSFFSFCAGV
jgi:hypothetical protein